MNTKPLSERITPGPWTASDGLILASHPGMTLYVAKLYDTSRQAGSIEANGELIAKAPDLLRQRDALLAACKFLLRVGPSGIIGQQTARENALAAIASVESEGGK